MAKEELIELDGTVTDVLPDGNFRVVLDDDREIIAYSSGRLRKLRTRAVAGDRVLIEMSPYDLHRGRISFRPKAETGSQAHGPRRRRFRRR